MYVNLNSAADSVPQSMGNFSGVGATAKVATKSAPKPAATAPVAVRVPAPRRMTWRAREWQLAVVANARYITQNPTLKLTFQATGADQLGQVAKLTALLRVVQRLSGHPETGVATPAGMQLVQAIGLIGGANRSLKVAALARQVVFSTNTNAWIVYRKAVAVAAAQGRLTDARFEAEWTNIINEGGWFGKFVGIYGAYGSANAAIALKYNLRFSGTLAKYGVQETLSLPTTPGPWGMTSARQTALRYWSAARSTMFAAIVASVNQVLYARSGMPKNAVPCVATPLTLLALYSIRHRDEKSRMGQLIYQNFTWTHTSLKAVPPQMDTVFNKLGGVRACGDLMYGLFTGRVKPAQAVAYMKQVTPVTAVQAASAIRSGSGVASAAAVTAKPAKTKAGGKLKKASAKSAVSPGKIAKAASKQARKVAGKLRAKLVDHATVLVQQKKTQVAAAQSAQATLAAAKQEAAQATSPQAKEVAQAKVEAAAQVAAQASAAVAQTDKQLQATDTALQKVDQAAATAGEAAQEADSAEKTEAAAESDGGSEQPAEDGDSDPSKLLDAAADAADSSAAKSADATAEAVAAASAVLPAEQVVDSVKSAMAEVKQDAEADAAATGDSTGSRALAAATDSGIVQDAAEGTDAPAEGGSSMALLAVGAVALGAFLYMRSRKPQKDD